MTGASSRSRTEGMRGRGSKVLRVAALLAALATVGALVPAWWCGRGAAELFDGDRDAQLALARGVARSIEGGVSAASFSTGSARFDGEWSTVTHQMAVLGLAQVSLEHPEAAPELRPTIEVALARLCSPQAMSYGRSAWGEDGLEALGSGNGHAYLGYVNLALGMERLLRPASPRAELHDRLTAALARRLDASPTALIETYPGETYPPDVAAVVGSIGLHDRVTGSDHGALLARVAAAYRDRYVDPRSGLLAQAVSSGTGEAVDHPRASGTAIAAYFLSFGDRALSRELSGAVRRNATSALGFGGVREYPRGVFGGLGDIDSGPVLLGVSVSATGFAIAGARLHGDRALYRSLYRTAVLFGVPVRRGRARWFVTGGPLGNAIMLAMLTAGPGAAPERERRAVRPHRACDRLE